MKEKLEEIKDLLKEIESFPKRRVTNQTATCILALMDTQKRDGLLQGKQSLSQGARIRNILDFKRQDLGEPVAENTRESYRKESLKPLCETGIAERHQSSVNDPNTYYTLNNDFKLIITDRENRDQLIDSWNKSHKSRYKKLKTKQSTADLTITYENKVLHLSPGKHSLLTKHIIEIFAPAYIPGFEAIYISDTRNKMLYTNKELSAALNIELDEHDKLPDVILYRRSMNIVYAIEAVSSVGPFSESRKDEVKTIFSKKGPIQFGIVLISAFPDRIILRQFISDLAWETKVWIAEEPYGIIHFDFIKQNL